MSGSFDPDLFKERVCWLSNWFKTDALIRVSTARIDCVEQHFKELPSTTNAIEKNKNVFSQVNQVATLFVV